jgi:TNF receptor-associated protein 1
LPLVSIRNIQLQYLSTVFTWQSSSVTTVIHRRYYSQEAHASNVITEKHEFQAETRKLLDIVAKSLYSEQEVFIRELISNASDALEKRRYIQLTTSTIDDQQHQQDHPLEISIDVDEKSRMFTIRDSGIGMNKQELIDCLGTIARSGSREFVSKLSNDTATSDSIIGQFGVGKWQLLIVNFC